MSCSDQDSVSLTGTLLAGPSQAGEDGSGATTDTFELEQPATVHTGLVKRPIASTDEFVALDGVGEGKTVEKATFVYVRTSSRMTLRLTTTVPDDDDNVVEIPVDGLFVMEVDAAHYVKLVELKGSATVKHFMSGAE